MAGLVAGSGSKLGKGSFMELDIVSFTDLMAEKNTLENALLKKGIVGVRHVPDFEKKTRAYIDAARKFAALEEKIKQQYTPERDAGKTEGYELGAEWFKDKDGNWQIDDKKASFYAYVPDRSRNKWPHEVDLKTAYLELGQLIFQTGKVLLSAMGLDERIGLPQECLNGYGRMLHYFKDGTKTNTNPDWCGAHLDHGILTGLVPAYYFQNGVEVDEPEEAGLYIVPTQGHQFEKVYATDKSILLFQVGEFGQLVSNDRIRATKHIVKKAFDGIERFTFALFHSASEETVVKSTSELISDARYRENQFADGSISYGHWQDASYARYRAK